LSEEVHRGGVLVQVVEDRSGDSESGFLKVSVFGVHVHDEWVSSVKEPSDLSHPAVGAVCVGLDELSDGEAIRGFFGRCDVLLMRGPP